MEALLLIAGDYYLHSFGDTSCLDSVGVMFLSCFLNHGCLLPQNPMSVEHISLALDI